MKIAALMPTYHLHERGVLIGEAIGSFLQQDHFNKRLFVCNDTPGQQLKFSHPDVHVINTSWAFDTLSDKLIFMINEAIEWGCDALCRWDDDDINLSHRLSLSERKLKEGERMEWRPCNYWWQNGHQDLEAVCHPGNTHTMSLWRTEVLSRIGGYPPKRSGNEDQEFNRLLRVAGLYDSSWDPSGGEKLSLEDIFYVYRWCVSSRTHLSSKGGTSRQLQAHWDDLSKAPTPAGTYSIVPRDTNYREIVTNRLRSLTSPRVSGYS